MKFAVDVRIDRTGLCVWGSVFSVSTKKNKNSRLTILKLCCALHDWPYVQANKFITTLVALCHIKMNCKHLWAICHVVSNSKVVLQLLFPSQDELLYRGLYSTKIIVSIVERAVMGVVMHRNAFFMYMLSVHHIYFFWILTCLFTRSVAYLLAECGE